MENTLLAAGFKSDKTHLPQTTLSLMETGFLKYVEGEPMGRRGTRKGPEPEEPEERHDLGDHATARGGRGEAGLFARRTAKRLNLEQLLLRAEFLPQVPRAMISAYFELGMPVEELAALHGVSISQMRRRLNHWRDTLSDSSFLLAAQFADRLPRELRDLAKEYWLGGKTMRELAAARRVSLYRVRSRIQTARTLLVVAMGEQQSVPAHLAQRFLAGKDYGR